MENEYVNALYSFIRPTWCVCTVNTITLYYCFIFSFHTVYARLCVQKLVIWVSESFFAQLLSQILLWRSAPGERNENIEMKVSDVLDSLPSYNIGGSLVVVRSNFYTVALL